MVQTIRCRPPLLSPPRERTLAPSWPPPRRPWRSLCAARRYRGQPFLLGHLTSAVLNKQTNKKSAVSPVTDGGALECGGSLKRADPIPAPTPPPASASLCHAAACFTTPSFLLCHLTSDPPPGTAGGPADGATAAAATTTDSGVDVDTDATPPAASADAHGSATKKRRRQRSRDMTRTAQRHCQRMAALGADRGNTPRSDPGPIEGRPAEDSAEWRRGRSGRVSDPTASLGLTPLVSAHR